MSNMSYCQFENAYRDLKNCLEALYSSDDLSQSEEEYRDALIRLCIEIADNFDVE